MEGLDEGPPMAPIALPFAVIRRHDPSVDASPLSSEQTFEISLSLRRKTRQESVWMGNVAANRCKKSMSDVSKVLRWAECRLNVREAMSAILLSVPAMETETSGEASLTWIRMASARTKRPATHDREELSLLVQLTVGVLSHHAATWTCLRDTICSNTR